MYLVGSASSSSSFLSPHKDRPSYTISFLRVLGN